MTAAPTLVTGGTGFVGAAVIRELLAHGHRVTALVRPGSDRRNLDGLSVALREGRLEDRESLVRAIDGAGALFHVAADYRFWVPDRAAMFGANVDGTRTLMEAALAAGVPRIVYTSSVAVLGRTPDRTGADETTPVAYDQMIGPYKQSKFRAEEAVRDLIATRGLPCIIVNPSAPVGPRDVKPTPTGRMVLDAARGRLPAYVDSGLNVVHVEDVAIGHRLAFERGTIGERYVLGGENVVLGDLLRAIARFAGRRGPLVQLPIGPLVPLAHALQAFGRMTGIAPPLTPDLLRMARHRMWFSSAKAAHDLGYRARPTEDAIADAVRWFRDNGYAR